MVAFEIRKDNNAQPHKRFILSVKKNGKCVFAPRYAFLVEALQDVAGLMEEYKSTNTKISITI